MPLPGLFICDIIQIVLTAKLNRMKKTLCPFSKPIIGNWCQCKYANFDDRCAGKMTCLKSDVYLADCYELVELFKENSLIVFGITQREAEITHMQLMQIRCGG